MKLHFNHMGQGEPIVILHGLFGSSDNWQTLGKQIAETHSVYLVDQRNHGRSPHSDAFDYDLLAADLKELTEAEGLDKITIVGHSMGGKTAMRFAQLFPSQIHKLLVVDMGVKSYPPHHKLILQALHAVKLDEIESRSDAEDMMKPYIADFGIRQFLLKNLYRKERNQFAWRINFEVLEARMGEILARLPVGRVDCDSLFVRGTKSDYIQPEDFMEIRDFFPLAKFADLPTGHWVHAEDPEGFLKILMEFVTE
jgi:pimeloyl-ACP methyl ester carboxylesterase